VVAAWMSDFILTAKAELRTWRLAFRTGSHTCLLPGKREEIGMSSGIVYILTNAAMPGYIKIGMTQQDDVSLRVDGPDTHRFSQCYLGLCDK